MSRIADPIMPACAYAAPQLAVSYRTAAPGRLAPHPPLTEGPAPGLPFPRSPLPNRFSAGPLADRAGSGPPAGCWAGTAPACPGRGAGTSTRSPVRLTCTSSGATQHRGLDGQLIPEGTKLCLLNSPLRRLRWP
jgi:hypothetical protein